MLLCERNKQSGQPTYCRTILEKIKAFLVIPLTMFLNSNEFGIIILVYVILVSCGCCNELHKLGSLKQ